MSVDWSSNGFQWRFKAGEISFCLWGERRCSQCPGTEALIGNPQQAVTALPAADNIQRQRVQKRIQ